MIIELFMIMFICTICIGKLNAIEEIYNTFLSLLFNNKIHKELGKPWTCPLCCTFWCCLIYQWELSLACIFYAVLFAWMSDYLLILIDKINNLFVRFTNLF